MFPRNAHTFMPIAALAILAGIGATMHSGVAAAAETTDVCSLGRRGGHLRLERPPDVQLRRLPLSSEARSGTWTLQVKDVFAGDAGTLTGWTLTG